MLGLGVGLYLARKGNPSLFLLWDRHVLSEAKLAAKAMYVALEESCRQFSLSNSTLWLPSGKRRRCIPKICNTKRIHALFTPLTGRFLGSKEATRHCTGPTWARKDCRGSVFVPPLDTKCKLKKGHCPNNRATL